ncbi:MAG: TerC family protein [Candidatus Promineifilaceae bacterium]
MAEIFTTEGFVALITLALLEIILGIDNVIFIAILSSKLPKEQQPRARQLGIAIAVISRLILLFVLTAIITRLQAPLVFGLSGRDMILLLGGLFLIGKSTSEIHNKLEGEEHGHGSSKGAATMGAVLAQIMLVDVVFSLDSVITAIGIAENLWIMTIAILISAAIMVFAANAISDFVERHPTMKLLALAFLILIGSVLVIEGWNPEAAHDLHIKNYVYFAMAFSLAIETMNIRWRSVSGKNTPVELNRPKLPTDSKH